MLELCRKRSMARNLMKIQKMFPEHYDFFPKTFILPSDVGVRLLIERGGSSLPSKVRVLVHTAQAGVGSSLISSEPISEPL